MSPKHLLTLITLSLTLAACGGGDDLDPGNDPAGKAETVSAGHADESGPEEGEGHAEESGHIALSAEQIRTAGIQLSRAGPARIRETLPLYGVIAPNAERTLEVAARYPGVIRTVRKRMGDAVQRGETLATVEANESLESYAVVAPLSGVVTTRNANPGEQTGDRLLFTVADLSTVWVELAMFPRDIAKVRFGQEVRVRNREAELEATGKVVYVSPFSQAASQTLSARVLLDNPERHWAPGLYVAAEVTLSEAVVPLAVRNNAVQTVDERSVVFVHGDEGFEPRPVRLGRSDAEFSEVLSGVEEGESYAAANSFILKAELGKGSAEHGH